MCLGRAPTIESQHGRAAEPQKTRDPKRHFLTIAAAFVGFGAKLLVQIMSSEPGANCATFTIHTMAIRGYMNLYE